MTTDNYDPHSSLVPYYPTRSSRLANARLWAVEKALHDLSALGVLDFFEGPPGSDPTQLPNYGSSKLWLKQSAGVQTTPGTVHYWNGTSPASDAANWPVLTAAANFITAAAASASLAESWATKTDADRVQTGLDRVQTGLDAEATDADRVQTGLDALATAAQMSTVLDPQFATRAVVISGYHPVTAPDYIRTAGYAAAGDGGAALYKKVVSQPSHAGKLSITTAAAATIWYEIAEPRLNVRMFGATGDGTTDATSAIQAAIDYVIAITTNRPAIYFPAGSYLISANLTVGTTSLSRGLKLCGDGNGRSIILASGAVTKMLELLGPSVSSYHQQIAIDGLTFDGNNVADYGIYGDFSAHNTLRDVRVTRTLTAAIKLGWAFSSVFDNVETVSNAGDGIVLRNQSNAIEMTGVKTFINGGVGIDLQECIGVAISGCTIEQNRKGGIFVGAACPAIAIIGNYFELNGEDGWDFTSPTSVNVKADIIINGAVNNATIANAFPSSAAIVGNVTDCENAEVFVFAPGIDMLEISGNKNVQTAVPLLGFYGSNSGSSAGASFGAPINLKVGDNVGFSKVFDISPLTYGILSYGTRTLSIEASDAGRRSLAVHNLEQWAVVSASNGGEWRRSAVVFPLNQDIPVWELSHLQANSSDIFGFFLNTAAYPDNAGKLFVFGVYVKGPFTANDGASWVYGNSLSNSSSFESNAGWQWKSVLFEWPASGSKAFGVRKAGAAGTIQVACPVLCELGAPVKALSGAFGQRANFFGTGAPTRGTWKRGDIVDNTTPSASGAPAWRCVTAGTLAAAWALSTAYVVGDMRLNDTNKIYVCTTAGTSASSGGPTGTGTAISDGTATWDYVGPLAVFKAMGNLAA